MFPSPFLDVWTKISFDNFSLPLVLSSLIMMCLGVLWVYPFYFRSFKSLIFIDLLSCLENPRSGGAWWAAVYGVAQSRTRLKQLSSQGH